MQNGIFLGFDFGYKRIGVAVGQLITAQARPLEIIQANQGEPNWQKLTQIINQWQPKGLIIGLPTQINGKEQFTTHAARAFAEKLHQQYQLLVYLEDERLSTIEARAQLFAMGGYRKISSAPIDSIAACIILEQWLQQHTNKES